jgi:hypothetical protein
VSSDRHTAVSSTEFSGGRLTKRASLLLFLIESRTAHLVVQMREVVAPYVSDKAEKKIERAFLDDLAQVRTLPVKPTIQDIERFARVWDYLVPPDLNIRAVLAHMLGENIFSRMARCRCCGKRSRSTIMRSSNPIKLGMISRYRISTRPMFRCWNDCAGSGRASLIASTTCRRSGWSLRSR